jgi:hypothetical protein
MGNILTVPMGNVLTARVGKVLDIYTVTLRAGYRILEGGANVEEAYNFALIHFFGAGLHYTF